MPCPIIGPPPGRTLGRGRVPARTLARVARAAGEVPSSSSRSQP
ncbi:hypothetical protein R0J90_09480 [Micrococcus sp. SIMBA_144]